MNDARQHQDFVSRQTIVEVKHPQRPDETLCRLLAELGLRITDEPSPAIDPVH